jgi:hydroxypyruvate reductase
VLSDVSGDDPALVGSGPAIRAVGGGPEGPHRNQHDHSAIIGSSATALEGARAEAFALRYATVVLDADLGGEARVAGERLARSIAALPDGAPPLALLLAGEPVVSGVPPGALGGRMQELALAAAAGISGRRAAILATSTDGRDGSADASGALVDGGTLERARSAGHDVQAALAAHTSTAVLAATGDLQRLGPTGTNVRDLVVALIR